MRRVPLTLDGNRICRARDFREVIGSQLDIGRAEILLEPVQFGGAGDRHDPGLLREEPREGDLRGRRLLLAGDAFKQINQRLILLQPCGVKRGRMFRKSPSPSLVSLFIAPVRKPLPSGL